MEQCLIKLAIGLVVGCIPGFLIGTATFWILYLIFYRPFNDSPSVKPGTTIYDGEDDDGEDGDEYS